MMSQSMDSLWGYHTSYSRNARAVGLAWAFCTIVFCVLAMVAFSQPRWIANYDGDTSKSTAAGYFGLYKRCRLTYSDLDDDDDDYTCNGEFSDWDSILNSWFKATTVLHGAGVILMLLCICCLLLFFLMETWLAYTLCGCVEFLAGACILAACLVYPNGWDDDEVRMVCGLDAEEYNLGECKIRWAYALAIICIFDALFLAMLAFVLATRQPKKLEERALLKRAELDDYRAEVESKASIAINPVITINNNNNKAPSEYSYRRGPPSRGPVSEYSYASTRQREFTAL